VILPAALPAVWLSSPAELVRIACVGDGSSQSYSRTLGTILGKGYRVESFGDPAATVATFSGSLAFVRSQAFKPNIVVIDLGANDAAPSQWPKSANRFVPSYEHLIASFRRLPTHPKVFAALPPNGDSARAGDFSSRLLPLIDQAARESGVPVIDLNSDLDPALDFEADHVTPNSEGSALLARTVAESVQDPAARKRGWRVVSVDSQEDGEGPARNAIDGDPETFWHTNYSVHETRPPHEIVVDLGRAETIIGFRHLPRQDGGVNGRVRAFELYLSMDGSDWGEPALKGEIPNTSGWTKLRLSKPAQARYFRFRAHSEWNNGPWTSVAELDVEEAFPGP